MKKEYEEAFSEVNQIFNLMPVELLNKIPIKFIELIREYKSNTYETDIHEPFESYKLKDETIIILSLIYRDFLCSSQEKQELLIRDSKKIQEIENELREKYNSDNIFQNETEISENLYANENQKVALVEYKEKNFLQKLFKKIRNLFKHRV